MLELRSHKDIFRVRYCRRARSITHLLHARLGYQHFSSIFCSTYSGSKSGPYRVILDRLSGQYREIWIGLGCRGLVSCMTTVTCCVINHYEIQEGCKTIQNKVLLEQNYYDSVLCNLQTGLFHTSCSHQHGIEE